MVDVLVPSFTADFRREELERGRRSLLYFGVSILGFDAKDPETGQPTIGKLHQELCAFLEGRPPHRPWNRALVCCARGLGKSVWTTQTYPMWRGLYIVNFSTKIIENSTDNAKRHHFLPLVDLFTTSPRADYLQWLFEHRLPSGFEGWNSEQIKLVQTDPLANPCLSYWGVESKFEGAHPDLVVGDDLEGADAQKSLAANEEAWNAYQSVIPLLKHPNRSQLLLVGTPHGSNPLVWRIRDREWKETPAGKRQWASEADNAWSGFKIFWRPILTATGESAWPERISEEHISTHLAKEDIFDQQYMLRRGTTSLSLFEMKRILGDSSRGDEGSCYSWADTRQRILVYPGFDYDPIEAAKPGYRFPEPRIREANIRDLRYYIHYDPLHKVQSARRTPLSKQRQRPAEAAMVVVGITSDYHALLVDYWHGDADIDQQLAHLFRLYCKWAPYIVTYEAVGAQVWIESFMRSLEKQGGEYDNPRSTDYLGTRIPLPRLSARMVEADKTNESKEWIYREVLSSWINRGLLHLRRDQAVVIHQLANVLNQGEAVDLVDCLAQGPALWVPPVAADKHARRYHEYVSRVNTKLAQAGEVVTGWMKRSGYSPPWQ